MLFYDVALTSRRVGETRKRLVKIELLASLLERLRGEEIEIAISFLSGILRQGSIGVGPAGRATGLETAVGYVSESFFDSKRFSCSARSAPSARS